MQHVCVWMPCRCEHHRLPGHFQLLRGAGAATAAQQPGHQQGRAGPAVYREDIQDIQTHPTPPRLVLPVVLALPSTLHTSLPSSQGGGALYRLMGAENLCLAQRLTS